MFEIQIYRRTKRKHIIVSQGGVMIAKNIVPQSLAFVNFKDYIYI